ncbi:polysaccharide deacetylase family protein [Chitinimonas koreensis]|uniref:polysaccharide deacetylase family protein n=1 Tax=Chitinimonas koreensis TaxID=356302 RepID=UPI000A074F27|nr:polysaccharide deacetylase family protein [Chitinimonas koreensis]
MQRIGQPIGRRHRRLALPGWVRSLIAGSLLGLGGTFAAAAEAPKPPQLIMFTIDDGMTETMIHDTEKITGVPWTYYLSVTAGQTEGEYDTGRVKVKCVDKGTGKWPQPKPDVCIADPVYVKRQYERGHEIALHTYTHPPLKTWSGTLTEQQVIDEISSNLEFIENAGVPVSAVKGFRAPYLATQASYGGELALVNQAMRYLQKAFTRHANGHADIVYDSSWRYSNEGGADTQDHVGTSPILGLRRCLASGDPAEWAMRYCGYDDRARFSWNTNDGSYPADSGDYNPANSWHIPMDLKKYPATATGHLDLMDTVQGYCGTHTCTAQTARDIWFSNFRRHYDGDRLPYGIYLHDSSLQHADQVQGMKEFVTEVHRLQQEHNDVFFVTGSQAIAYARLTPAQRETCARAGWDKFFKIGKFWGGDAAATPACLAGSNRR